MDSDPQTDAIVEARLASLRLQYPGKFGPEDEPRIRERIERSVKFSANLKKHHLANGDQPFLTLIGFGARSHE
jgi:hypothetical protein